MKTKSTLKVPKINSIIVKVILLVFFATLFKSAPSFGVSSSGEHLEKIEANKNYKDGAFFNDVPQSEESIGLWNYISNTFWYDEIRIPPAPLPLVKPQTNDFSAPPAKGLRIIWLGHSSVLIEQDGFRYMIDPVFSDYASPVQFAGPLRFHEPPIALKDLPKIDAVLISHDHYDHLDMKTIRHLSVKGTQFYVPMGIGALLEKWDVPNEQINEMQWGETKVFGNTQIICTPSRHYSGRGLFDYKEQLWSSWTVIGIENKVYYSGDTGFSGHFETTANQYGPFDLTIIKVGAYGPGQSWIDIHMSVEDAVKAHQKLKGKVMLPVHWGTFNMGFHDWDEPIKRTVKAASDAGITLVTPKLGETVDIKNPYTNIPWWESVKAPNK
jgi:L-ascorbate metabolism protein UlaG (beta-lactamase superfamily)